MKKISTKTKWIMRMYLIISSFLALYAILFFFRKSYGMMFFFLIFCGVFLYIYFALPKRMAAKYYAHPDNYNVFSPLDLTFTEEGCSMNSKASQSSIIWNGIPKIYDLNSYLLIFHGERTMWAIPKHQLTSEELAGIRKIINQCYHNSFVVLPV